MTAHQARRGGGPDPTGPSRAGRCRADAHPGALAAEAEREWDPLTRLLLLLELSGRRSWLEDLASPDRT